MEISNTTQQNNCSFKARICINDNAFNKMLNKIKGKAPEVTAPWRLGNEAIEKPVAYTMGAYNCLVVSIINPEKHLVDLWHFEPNAYNAILAIDHIKESIIKRANQLKGKSDVPLEGLLIGGEGGNAINEKDKIFRKEFMNLFNEISEKIGMTYSTITGRKEMSYGVNVITDAKTNTHYININSPIQVTPNKEKGLKKLYNCTRISSQDSLDFLC